MIIWKRNDIVIYKSEAAVYLANARASLASSLPSDLVAEDLRLATRTLGSITGAVTDSDILQNIFRNFCIGK